MMATLRDNGPTIPKYQYNNPNMNKWLITTHLPNIDEIYKIRQNKRFKYS